MPSKTPSWATRRAACTHLTMERLYGDYQCSVCHRPSQLGWVYFCTQDDTESTGSESVDKILQEPISTNTDDGEILSTSEKPTQALTLHPEATEDIPEFLMPTSKVAPWIEKAIACGHYTPDQVEILQAQRQTVVDVANAAVYQYEREEMSKGTGPLTVTLTSKRSKHNGAAIERHESQPLARLKMFPYCKFRSCQACRPSFRERTWGRFEDVYAKEVSDIVGSEHCDFRSTRPLASQKVLKTIGLKTLSVPKPPPHRLRRLRPVSVSDSNIHLRSMKKSSRTSAEPYDAGRNQVTNLAVPDTRDVDGTGLDLDSAPSDLQESMVRAFRGARNRSQSSPCIEKPKTELESETSIDLALKNCLDDSLAQQAASIPFPGSISLSGLVAESRDAENNHLVEGAAVTEESAEIGTADIITSM